MLPSCKLGRLPFAISEVGFFLVCSRLGASLRVSQGELFWTAVLGPPGCFQPLGRCPRGGRCPPPRLLCTLRGASLRDDSPVVARVVRGGWGRFLTPLWVGVASLYLSKLWLGVCFLRPSPVQTGGSRSLTSLFSLAARGGRGGWTARRGRASAALKQRTRAPRACFTVDPWRPWSSVTIIVYSM